MLKLLTIIAILYTSGILGDIRLTDGDCIDCDEHMGWMMEPWLWGIPILMWVFMIFGSIILVLFLILLIKLAEKR